MSSGAGKSMYRVLIIQAEMKRYRVPLFTIVHAELLRDHIELTVAYSNSNRSHALRGDSADLPLPIGGKVAGHWFFHRFIYQPLWRQIIRADLVIVGPEIKYLINPILLLMSGVGLKKVAFFGLGPNRFPDRSPLAEWIKKHFFTRVDWWFAYTASIAEHLESEGMPADRITNVQNATDSTALRSLLKTIEDEEVVGEKMRLTGSRDSRIGFYCGTLGEIKAIPLLVSAARLVKLRCPEFHLVVIGNGPQRPWLERAVVEDPWIHYLGSKYDRESALYYKMADIFLLAGTVGLAIADSFAAGLPVVATDLPTHPPEISYIAEGYNGRLVPHEERPFADAIIAILSDSVLMQKLREGAQASASLYTMEAMVDNFRRGIEKCLHYYGFGEDARGLATSRTNG